MQITRRLPTPRVGVVRSGFGIRACTGSLARLWIVAACRLRKGVCAIPLATGSIAALSFAGLGAGAASTGLGILVTSAYAATATEAYHAPLDGELRITGTFGEPRDGHLHTGLDLSTGGETGWPVRALAAGWVVRLRAGATGYGRALYLETDAGEIIVYGHLSSFAPGPEAYLREAQRRRAEFEIDVYPPRDGFAVSAGDTIAYSGASGAGPPHLHMEIRRGDRPLNPLLVGIAAADHLTPEWRAVRLRALSPSSYAGGAEEWLWTAARDARGGLSSEVGVGLAIADAPVIEVCGWIGVEAAVHDGCGLTGARLAPLEITMTLDGQVLFARRFGELSFGRGWEVNRIYGRPAAGERTWVQRFYQWPLETGPDEGSMAGHGWLDTRRWGTGLHELRLAVIDAAGHRSEWMAMLDVVDAPAAGLGAELLDTGGDSALGPQWRVTGVEIAEGLVTCDLIGPRSVEGPWRALLVTRERERVPLRARGRGADGAWRFAVLGCGVRGQVAGLEIEGAGGWSAAAPFCGLAFPGTAVAGHADTLWLRPGPDPAPAHAGAAVRLELHGRSRPETIGCTWCRPGESDWPDVLRSVEEHHRPGELRLLTPVVDLDPAWWPLEEDGVLGFTHGSLLDGEPELAPGWGLYRQDEDGGWEYVDARNGPGWLGGSLGSLGRFALLEDRLAPGIEQPTPAEGERLARPPAFLRVRLDETGSGFEPERADIFLGGQMLLAEYDIDEKWLRAEVAQNLPDGSHSWEVRVVDRAGRMARQIYQFDLRREGDR